MIDLILGIALADAEMRVFGPLLPLFGAITGALLGSFSTFLIGNYQRGRQIERSELERRRDMYIKGGDALGKAQANLHTILMTIEGNRLFTSDLKDGIFSNDGKHRFLMTLPALYEVDSSLSGEILKSMIRIYWANLVNEALLQNKNITDFNMYYTNTRDEVHKLKINGNRPNDDALKVDSSTFIKSAKDQLKAVDSFRRKSIRILALIDLFYASYKDVDVRLLNHPDGYRDLIDEMVAYEPTDDELAKHMDEVEESFDPKRMFESTVG